MTAPRPMTRPPIILYLTWVILIGAAVGGFLTGEFSVTFVAAGTLLLSLVPIWLGEKVGVTLPTAFVSAIAAFLCATLLLGEVGDFYERATGGGTWCCTAARRWRLVWLGRC